MKVYRYLSEKELAKINSKDSNLGSENKYTKEMNNFRYKNGVRYIHFFKDKNLMQEIKRMRDNDKQNYYFCTFEIPYSKLFFHKGKGIYDSKTYDYPIIKVREYAIDAKDFKSEWLKEAKLDVDKQEKISRLPSQNSLHI